MNWLTEREPVLTMNAIAALLMLAVGFGLPVTPEQVALINVAVVAVLSFVLRKKVDSPHAVNQMVQAANLKQPLNKAR